MVCSLNGARRANLSHLPGFDGRKRHWSCRSLRAEKVEKKKVGEFSAWFLRWGVVKVHECKLGGWGGALEVTQGQRKKRSCLSEGTSGSPKTGRKSLGKGVTHDGGTSSKKEERESYSASRKVRPPRIYKDEVSIKRQKTL